MNEAGFQQSGADRHISSGLNETFINRARGMSYFLPQIPKQIQNGFNNALAPRRLFIGQQE